MSFYEIIIMVCYVFPLILSVKMIQSCRENYERLPEKIPVHFGLAGAADRWARKSLITVYWPSAFVIGMDALFFVQFYYLPRQTRGFIPEMSVAMSLLNVAIAIFFYRVNDGIIDYALGRAKSIWPYIKLPLAIVLIGCALTVFPFIIPVKPQLVEHHFCESVDNHNNPVGVRDFFSSNHEKVVFFLKWRNLNGRHVLHYMWYDPEGEQNAIGSYELEKFKFRRGWRTWWFINIRDKPRAEKTGTWTVVVLLDGKQVVEGHFVLER